MDVQLEKVGNRTVLVLTPKVLRALRLRAGQHLTLDTTADGRVLLTPKRRFILADMIAQCDMRASPPKDLGLWAALLPVGRETL